MKIESQERRQKPSQLHSFPGDKPGAETELLCVPLRSEPVRGARGGSGDTITGSRRGQQSRPTLFSAKPPGSSGRCSEEFQQRKDDRLSEGRSGTRSPKEGTGHVTGFFCESAGQV